MVGKEYDIEESVDASSTENERDGGSTYRVRFLIAGLLLLSVLTVSVLPVLSKNQISVEEDATSRNLVDLDLDTDPRPFGDILLAPFSEEVLQGYSSAQEFEDGLTNLVKFALSDFIVSSIERKDANVNNYTWNDDTMEWEEDDSLADMELEEVFTVYRASSRSGPSNRQAGKSKKKKREADIIVTDDQYVYYADGADLVVLDREGALVTRRAPKDNDSGQIHALHVIDNYAMVISTHYEYDYGYHIVKNRNDTIIQVYSIPTTETPEMEFVAGRNVNGEYIDSAWLQVGSESSIQLVTKGGLDPDFVLEYLESDQFPWTSKSDYVVAAAALSTKRLIPKLVHTLSEEISFDGELPHILGFNAWTTTGETPYLGGNNLLNEMLESYTQVTSINVKAFTNASKGHLKATAAVLLTPQLSSLSFYGADSSLALALGMEMYEDSDSWSSHTRTFLFKINVATDGNSTSSTTFHSLTSVDGKLANADHSLNIEGDDLRVAITTDQDTPSRQEIENTCGSYPSGACTTEEVYEQCKAAVHSCDSVVREGCPFVYRCADGSEIEPISSTLNQVIVFDVAQGGNMTELGRASIGEPDEVIFGVHFSHNFSYAVTFHERDPFYAIELEAGQAPIVTGSVKPDGYYAYFHPMNDGHTILLGVGQNTTGSQGSIQRNGLMVTVFDATDPEEVKTLASHMLETNENVVSSSAAEVEGNSVGYFDGKLVLPVYVEHYPYNSWDDDDNSVGGTFDDDTSSAGNETTRNEMDLDFDGFVVLDVSAPEEKGIKEVFRISHVDVEACSWCHDESEHKHFRSFLYGEDVLVTIGHSLAIGSNINSGEELWRIRFD